MNTLIKIGLLATVLMTAKTADAQSEVTFYTSMGKFTIDLTDALTPVTVDSFLARTNRKFYDGVIFHRVINNFMIQGGDPTGTGSGGTGTTIPDEFDPTLKNVPKALAMANIGTPNTGDCQFFINLVTNAHLNNKHTVFGMVTTNFNIVQDIGKVPKDANDKPLTNVVIDSIRVTRPVSVPKLSDNNTINIYPNPGKGIFNIDLPAITTKVEIVNATGQLVYKKETKGTLRVDLRTQPAGLYTVHITNTKGTADSKLILQ